MRIAAVLGPTAASSAATSPIGRYTKPGGIGAKPSWYLGCAVAASAPSVRPWKLLWNETISTRSFSPRSQACRRASLMAASLASAPELEKNTRSAKEAATRRSASRIEGSLQYRFEAWMSLPACSWMAATRPGCPCPSEDTAIPPTRST